MNRIGIAIIALATTATLAAAHADAQYPGGPGGGTRQGGHIPPSRADGPRAADVPVSLTGQAQLVLDKLEDDLRIGAHQQKAWDAYAAKVIRFADDLARARYSARDMQDGGLTAPQQFDRLADIAHNRMTAVEEIVEAGRAVYATLGPDQRPLADKGLVLVPLRLVSNAVVGTGAPVDERPVGGTRPRSP